MPLTTLFGSAQLALQDALRRNIDSAGGTVRAPNFVIATLPREDFLHEFPGAVEDAVARFKRELEGAMRSFVNAHGWSIGGSGMVVLNVQFGDAVRECGVRAWIARSFYALRIEDDAGGRIVQVGSNPTIVGREHDFPPRGFVALRDARRIISREHLRLHYADLRLHVRLLGCNPTMLNGVPMGEDEVEVSEGDVLECGSCRITIGDPRLPMRAAPEMFR